MKYKSIRRSQCYCISLSRACNAVMEYYDRAFAKENITTKQYSLLINLSRMGEASVGELAEYVNLERSTVTRNLKILVSHGWICDIAKENSRSRKYIVTQAGEERIKRCIPIWDSCQAEMRQMIGEDTMSAMLDILYSLQKLQKEE